MAGPRIAGGLFCAAGADLDLARHVVTKMRYVG
jgi:hypothetical protein